MRLSFLKLSWNDLTAPWVHPSVPSGCDEFKHHLRFIQQSAGMGMLGLCLTPAVLALKQQASLADLSVFALVASPLALAALVSRTGKLELGKRIALICLASLFAVLIGASGGLLSPLAAIFCILPLEAVLWRCKSPLHLAISLVIGASVGASLIDASFATSAASHNMVSASGLNWLAGLGVIYAISVGIRIQARLVSSAGNLERESRRVDLFSKHSGELITRHASNGSTLFASPAARELLGIGGKDLLDNGLVNRVHIQDRVVLLKALSDAIQLGSEQLGRIRIRVSGTQGRLWKQVEIRCRADQHPALVAGGGGGGGGAGSGVSEAVCIMRDVSSLHEMEENLEKANASVDELNDAQRRFLATMSHELRTPLNAIVGFSDILQQELFGRLPHEKHREYVDLIQESGRHLLNVVNDMLDMSRIEAGKYELSVCPFAFPDIMDSTVGMLHPLAAKGGVTIRSNMDRSLPEISADKRACQQILINLLSNAIKFTPEGGNVTLSVKQFGRSLRVRFADDGIGIAEEFLPTIGRPFTQADTGLKRQFEGSGIGLSVVKGLVSLHGGEFDIKSKLGSGTVVTITLPLSCASSTPVPSDTTTHLVHLNTSAAETVQVKPVSAPISKGDHRARVSA